MRSAVIVDAVRSPIAKGKAGGALAGLHPVDLLAQVLRQVVDRNGIDPGCVDDVVTGCVSQVGEQSATPGRMAWLAAGLPDHVPATTIDRKCGSSQQAVTYAAYGVMAGQQDVVIACGVESMSRVVMGSARMDADPYGAGLAERYAPGLISQGLAAELVADRWGLTRTELDEYSVRSHRLAGEAAAAGLFGPEIVPITTAAGVVSADETIRAGSSVEKLAGLSPSFRSPEAQSRFPQLDFKITAGNSSQITDGAAAVLVMSEEAARARGLRPRARLHAFSQVADDPMLMLTAPIPATRKVLDRAGLSLADIDLFEVNEAFAPVPLAWAQELKVPEEKVNVRGGAIALGHPLGASGARLMTTLLATLEERDLTWGLQTMCEAGGMANATIIERI
jgi:acetyl-CoA acyltransferase